MCLEPTRTVRPQIIRIVGGREKRLSPDALEPTVPRRKSGAATTLRWFHAPLPALAGFLWRGPAGLTSHTDDDGAIGAANAGPYDSFRHRQACASDAVASSILRSLLSYVIHIMFDICSSNRANCPRHARLCAADGYIRWAALAAAGRCAGTMDLNLACGGHARR